MPRRKASEPQDGYEDINSGVSGAYVLADARPRGIYYDRYGKEHEDYMDGQTVELNLLNGLSLTKPKKPAPAPVRQQTRSGAWFEFSSTQGDTEPVKPAASVPLTTLYTPGGEPRDLPADAESIKSYLSLGFTLDPPNVSAATG